MTDITTADIQERLSKFCQIVETLRHNNGKLWWRVGSTDTDIKRNPNAITINDQIGVSLSAMNVIDGRWTKQFTTNVSISQLGNGFICRKFNKSYFVSVCNIDDPSFAPNNDNIITKSSAIKRQVDVGLKEVIKLQQQRLKRDNNDKPSPTNTAPAAATKVSPQINTPASTSNPLNQNVPTTTKRDAVSINNGEDDKIESPPKKMKSSIGIADFLSGSTETDGKNKEGGLVVDISITEDDITKIQNAALSFLTNQLSAHTNKPDEHLQNFAQSILSRLLKESNDGTVKIAAMDSQGRFYKDTFIRLPRSRSCNPPSSTSTHAKNQYVRKKAKIINTVLHSFLDGETKFGKKIAYKILSKVGEDYDVVVHRKHKIELGVKDVIVLRDACGGSTNFMYRFASGLKALRPDLILFPTSLKHQIAVFEGSNNVTSKTVLRHLQVNKDDTRSKLLPLSYATEPWAILELMVDKSKVDHMFEQSEKWMNPNDKNKIVLTYNIDKGGDDILASIRLLNRKNGNSMKHTYMIASVGGPVMESYNNELKTIFSPEFPIRDIIQDWVYDSLFVLSIEVRTNSNKSQCQSITLKPSTFAGICVDRSIEAILELESPMKISSVKDTDIEFDDKVSASGGPPEIDMPVDLQSMLVRLVTSKDNEKIVVGVELKIGGDVKLRQKLREPLKLPDNLDTSVNGDIKLSLQQVIGIPANDGKQQNIIAGICSNSCLSPCACCTTLKANFKQMTKRLWDRMKDRGLVTGDYPYPDDIKLREGDMSTIKCAEVYCKETMDGKTKLTDGQQRDLNIVTASVKKTNLVHEPPQKQTGEPMHEAGGAINHLTDKVRKRVRELEANEPFMNIMKAAKKRADDWEEALSTTPAPDRVGDPTHVNLLASLHREHTAFRVKIKALYNRIKELEEQKKASASEGDEADDGEAEVDEDAFDEINDQIDELREQANDLWEQCKTHAVDSKYSHYVGLSIGLLSFSKAITKFLHKKSKRARGKLEHAFNNALQYLGGGAFNAEHGGYEQTTGRAMNTLKNFDDIASVCENTYPAEHALHNTVKADFAKYREVAKKLYILTCKMKSQSRLDSEEFDDAVIDTIVAWNAAFPDEPYFNKLHFIMCHLPEFVRRYRMCGRASAESHESAHAMIHRLKNSVKRLPSTNKRGELLFARTTANLKPGMARRERKIREKQTGIARGKYNTNKETKRQDNVDFEASIFGDEVTVGNDTFVELVSGGRIHAQLKDVFLIVKAGKVPDDWVAGIEQTNLLSAAKLEQAKYSDK